MAESTRPRTDTSWPRGRRCARTSVHNDACSAVRGRGCVAAGAGARASRSAWTRSSRACALVPVPRLRARGPSRVCALVPFPRLFCLAPVPRLFCHGPAPVLSRAYGRHLQTGCASRFALLRVAFHVWTHTHAVTHRLASRLLSSWFLLRTICPSHA